MDGSDVDFEADAGPANPDSASSGSSVDFEDDFGDHIYASERNENSQNDETTPGGTECIALKESLQLDRMVAWIACMEMDLQGALEEHRKEEENVQAIVHQIQELRDATLKESWRYLEKKQNHSEIMARLNERKMSLLEFRSLSELVPKGPDLTSSTKSGSSTIASWFTSEIERI